MNVRLGQEGAFRFGTDLEDGGKGRRERPEIASAGVEPAEITKTWLCENLEPDGEAPPTVRPGPASRRKASARAAVASRQAGEGRCLQPVTRYR